MLKSIKINKSNSNNKYKYKIVILITLTIAITLYLFYKYNNTTTNTTVNNNKSSTKNHNSNTTDQPTLDDFFDKPIAKSNTIVNDDYFNDVIFIGDSITSGIKLYKTAKNAMIISKTGLNIDSITKDSIEIDNQVISILDTIKQSGRKQIYIMIGSNGIGWLTNEYMTTLYSNWLNKLRSEIPDCVIYVQSILPITKKLSDFNENQQNTLTNEKIEKYNNEILNMCKNQHFFYLNIAEAFKDQDGNLPDEASPIDGMHINANYYNIWLNYIKSHTIDSSSIKIIKHLSENEL